MAKKPDQDAAERANRLREQIDRLTKPGRAGAEAHKKSKPETDAENPRDFIHRRMREIDKDDKR